MPSHGGESRRCGRFGPGSVPPAFPQDSNLSRRIGFFHMAASHDRQRGVDAPVEESLEPDAESSGPKRDVGAPDLRLSGAVDRVNLERSIEKLPPGYRTVFILHDVQGYEHNEIADIMGCSVGNSKSQLHKARTRLRELLQEEIREQARQDRHAAKTQTGPSD
jgi:DNA-directed RNA polymerase specialized sigma24 family protein